MIKRFLQKIWQSKPSAVQQQGKKPEDENRRKIQLAVTKDSFDMNTVPEEYYGDIERFMADGFICIEDRYPKMQVYPEDNFMRVEYCIDSGCSPDEDGYGEEPSVYIAALADREGNIVEPFKAKYSRGWG